MSKCEKIRIITEHLYNSTKFLDTAITILHEGQVGNIVKRSNFLVRLVLGDHESGGSLGTGTGGGGGGGLTGTEPAASRLALVVMCAASIFVTAAESPT